MKELKRKSLLILGLVIATLALINNFSYADSNINTNGSDIKMQVEQLAVELMITKIADEVKSRKQESN